MFKIISTPIPTNQSVRTKLQQSAIQDILLDVDMDTEGDEGSSRAQNISGGRVTGPGDVIADSGKWMR